MNREEWAAWAKSLKPGDSVIVKGGGNIWLDTVKKVTPSGWVVTSEKGTYSMSKWFNYYTERGGYKDLVPYTEQLAKEAEKQKLEMEQRQKAERAIRSARIVTYDWTYGKREVDYGLACKILSLAGVEVE